MSKKKVIGILAGVFSFGLIVSLFSGETTKTELESRNSTMKEAEIKVKTCDGIDITSECEYDGVMYSLYKYYPAEEEQYHLETVTTYTEEIVRYCTLCNDGTYSPTCATGKGACSHHGGVAQWNAPVYRKVANHEQVKVVDKEAVEERYEKIVKE